MFKKVFADNPKVIGPANPKTSKMHIPLINGRNAQSVINRIKRPQNPRV